MSFAAQEARFHRCPIEWNKNKPATWKEWRPNPGADGVSFQDVLQTVEGTRHELMERVMAVYRAGDPHAWIESWLTHQRCEAAPHVVLG